MRKLLLQFLMQDILNVHHLTEYKTQNRGGVGQKASTTRNEDFLEHLFVGTNHQYMLFFTQKGKCFWMRVYEIPEGSKTSKGRAIQNLN